jgi:hypothetical protein
VQENQSVINSLNKTQEKEYLKARNFVSGLFHLLLVEVFRHKT